MTCLRGLTWDHPRGYRGLDLATRQYMERRPTLAIIWDRQPLHGFESHPIADLAERYDLLVLDHPTLGDAHRAACLMPLDPHAAALRLRELTADVAGASLEIYRYAGRLWALPLDAACEVSAYRPDLMAAVGMEAPRTFDEVRVLARIAGVAVGLKGVHSFLIFTALCASLGAPPLADGGEEFVRVDTGLEALVVLQEICAIAPAEAVDWNAIDVLDAMSERDDLAYCPYVFGYAPYSDARRARSLRVADLPGIHAAGCHGSVIGGTGLAISAGCAAPEEAIQFAAYLLSADVQKRMALAGAHPGRRSVWQDPEVNAAFGDFYRNTLRTLEQAYVRPRYPGYFAFQYEAGQVMEAGLRDGWPARRILDDIEALHRRAWQSGFEI